MKYSVESMYTELDNKTFYTVDFEVNCFVVTYRTSDFFEVKVEFTEDEKFFRCTVGDKQTRWYHDGADIEPLYQALREGCQMLHEYRVEFGILNK